MERDWKDRLKDEYMELTDSMNSLSCFIYSATEDFDRAQLGLMEVQLHIMDSYRIVLEERVRVAGIQL